MGWPKGRKRGAGRPRNSIGDDRGDNIEPAVSSGDPAVIVGGDGIVHIDPNAIGGEAGGSEGGGTGTGTRRTYNKKKKDKVSVNVSSVEMMLYSVHNMLATLTKVEELEMEEKEAKTMAIAIAKVAEHYDAIPGMSEKAAAWTNLAMVMGTSYGPRIVAYRFRQANEAKQNASGGRMMQ